MTVMRLCVVLLAPALLVGCAVPEVGDSSQSVPVPRVPITLDLPTSTVPPTMPTTTVPPTIPIPVTTPTIVHYADCASVRAAGAAPLYWTEPGYRTDLDRDHDGIACES